MLSGPPLRGRFGRQKHRSNGSLPMPTADMTSDRSLQYCGSYASPDLSLHPQHLNWQHQMVYGRGRRGRITRSADPSPQRTAEKLETMRNLREAGLLMKHETKWYQDPPDLHPPPLGSSTQSLPQISVVDFQQGHDFDRISLQPAHHRHQVVYVCHGQCTGPQCDFSQKSRQWQSMTYIDSTSGQEIDLSAGFRSEVVEMAPYAFKKLESKKASMTHMKELLATKLESKQRHKLTRRRRREGRDRRNSVSSEQGFGMLDSDRSFADSKEQETRSLSLTVDYRKTPGTLLSGGISSMN